VASGIAASHSAYGSCGSSGSSPAGAIGGEYTAINSAIDELIPVPPPGPGWKRLSRHLLGRLDDRRHRNLLMLDTHIRQADGGRRIGFFHRPGAA